MLFAAAASAAVALIGYAYYSQKPEKKVVARLLVCKKTPFHSVICPEKSQEEKELAARTWLEKYVVTVLLKRNQQVDCQPLPDSNN